MTYMMVLVVICLGATPWIYKDLGWPDWTPFAALAEQLIVLAVWYFFIRPHDPAFSGRDNRS